MYKKGIVNMFIRKSKVDGLEAQIEKLNQIMEKTNLMELYYLVGNKKQILFKNLVAGILRGVGIGIGLSIITAIIVILLQKIVTLNIPIIGDYIADIVEIVQQKI